MFGKLKTWRMPTSRNAKRNKLEYNYKVLFRYFMSEEVAERQTASVTGC